MLEWLYRLDMAVLFPLTTLLLIVAAEAGSYLGRRTRRGGRDASVFGTLTGAVLGLVGLLLAFSFSLALSRFDAQRAQVLQEANAIGTAANYAQMLPDAQRRPVLAKLRDYTALRVDLGAPQFPEHFAAGIARSTELQAGLWQLADAATAAEPQSLPVYRFVAALNELTNIHEARVTALRYRVPSEVLLALLGVAMVGLGFAGYNSAAAGSRFPGATVVMSITIAALLMVIMDLDRPNSGLIRIPVQPLIDAAQSIPP